MERRSHNRLLRFGVLLLAVLLVGALGIAAAADQAEDPACYGKGDVNTDGTVDSRDAIYTLYHHMDEERYPINQNWDFNGDAATDNKDAIFVLYHFLFPENADYALEGMAHGYYDPVWKWFDVGGVVTAEVTVKCGCTPQPHTLTIDEGVEVTSTVVTAATCTQSGKLRYAATVTYQDETFTATMEKDIPMTGHAMDGIRGCLNGVKCTECGYEEPGWGHDWVAQPERDVPATCTEKGAKAYRCSICGEDHFETVEEDVGHTLVVLDQDKALGGCQFVKQYRCEVCGEIFDGTAGSDTYVHHTYTAALTKEATCREAGVKTYTCTECGHSYTEEVPVDSQAHDWDTGTPDGTTITYTCQAQGCTATKTAVDASAAAVTKESLENVSELQLAQGAAMTLEEDTLEKLKVTTSIQVEVKEADLTETSLTEEQKQQVGNNTVYDFNMLVNGEKVTEFDTEITISLPYTLEEGEDVDSIDVWYLDDDSNEPVRVNATYSNGFVTFKTNHFSRYTVTRLTPAERCARYGHAEVHTHKDATCTEDGYDTTVCQRCGQVVEKKVYEKLGHDLTHTHVDATCTTSGMNTTACSRCTYTAKEILPKIGHDLEEIRTAATCETEGKVETVCKNDGCTYKTEKVLAKLGHSYAVAQTKAADCTSKGYDLEVCSRCKQERYTNEIPPVGHSYIAENAYWTWQPDGSGAVLTVSCAHDSTHTKQINANVTYEVKEANSCMSGGAVVYTAKVSFNGQTYTDTMEITSGAVGHKPGSGIKNDASGHFYLCTACGEKVNAADHTWGESYVKQAPTCDKEGTAVAQCTVCGYEKTWALAATGEHNFVHDVCTQCGYDQKSCDHVAKNTTSLDLSGYDFCEGVNISVLSCDCGRNQSLNFEAYCNNTEYSESYPVTLPNGETVVMQCERCKDCGLGIAASIDCEVEEDTCVGRDHVLFVLMDGDTVIGTFEQTSPLSTIHPTTETLQTVDLAQLGLCGGELKVTGCKCGDSESIEFYSEGCEWGYEYDPETQTQTQTCIRCGASISRTHKTTPDKENCRETYEISVKICGKDGTLLWSDVCTGLSEAHDNALVDYIMYGDTCQDGVLYTIACKTCGKQYTELTYNHLMADNAYTDLSDRDFCYSGITQHTCLCGQSDRWYEMEAKTQGGCQYFDWFYNPKTGVTTGTCAECGAAMKSVTSTGPKNANCEASVTGYTTYTDKDGNHIITVYESYTTMEHDCERECQLLGQSCEDGVRIHEVCKDCGYEDTWVTYYHETSVVEIVDLTEYGICPTQAVIWECPCGEESWCEFDAWCDFQWVEGFADGYIEQCAQCGLIRKYEEVGETVEGCQVTIEYKESYYLGDTLLLEVCGRGMGDRHTMLTTFNLFGSTCAEGYEIIETCSVCGETRKRTSEGSGCRSAATVVAQEVIGETPCGPITMDHISCACGGVNEWSINCNCNEANGYHDPDLNTYVRACSECGYEIADMQSEQKIEGTCDQNVTRRVLVRHDGETVADWEKVFTRARHNNTYVLPNDVQNCEEGFVVTATCADCGAVTMEEIRWHETFPVFQLDLEDYGVCPGEFAVYNCACRKESGWDQFESTCEFREQATDPETGLTGWYCGKCNTYIYWGPMGEKGENCILDGYMGIKLVRNGEVLLYEQVPFVTEVHEFEIVHYELLDSALGCEGGVRITRRCADCAREITDINRYGHEAVEIQKVELEALGGCGGWVQTFACACGEQVHVERNLKCAHMVEDNWTETIDGKEHHFSRTVCGDCGLVYLYEDVWEETDDPCVEIRHENHTVTIGDQKVFSYAVDREDYMHDYAGSYRLAEGSETCEDGLIIDLVCENCGYQNTGKTAEHMMNLVETIDLAPYGAVCGSCLNRYTCPCGKKNSVELDEAAKCDFYPQPIDVWDENAMAANCGQDSTSGYGWLNEEAALYYCGVTEPQCGLKMRYARYYLLEGCEAVEYQVWQLGYDETTGQCQEEIKSPTGNRYQWHTYETKESTGTEGDQTVYTEASTCTVCGSTVTRKRYYDNGDQIARMEVLRVNALDNSYPKSRSQTEVYGLTYAGYSKITEIREETVYADGSEYWSEETYTYDFSDSCQATVKGIDSNGEEWEYTQPAHEHTFSQEKLAEATCSQPAKWKETEICDICKAVINEHIHTRSPIGHSFNWDEDLQTYVCSVCGMKNDNGATGSVILEDLTDTWGEDTNYVVGYYDPEELKLSAQISVVLLDAAEGQENELVLSGIALTWLNTDVVAVRFPMEAAQTAAQAAVADAGYTGSYALRVTFIPQDAQGELDYAITFDAEQ